MTGSDFHAFFYAALRGTGELPYAAILPHAGLTLTDTGGDSNTGSSNGDDAHHYRLDLAPQPTPEQTAILRAISGGESSPKTP